MTVCGINDKFRYSFRKGFYQLYSFINNFGKLVVVKRKYRGSTARVNLNFINDNMNIDQMQSPVHVNKNSKQIRGLFTKLRKG